MPPVAPWYVKQEPTFSNAAATARRPFWAATIFQQPRHARAFDQIPSRLRNLLLDRLSAAA